MASVNNGPATSQTANSVAALTNTGGGLAVAGLAFASLPSAVDYPPKNGLFTIAYTTDQGVVYSNGTTWVALISTASAASTSNFTVGGQLILSTTGKGISVAEGTNAKMGVATLVTGTKVVATTAVTATSRIFLTTQSLGTVTVPSALAVSARTAATSFTILASDGTDTSVVAWMIVEPA